MKARVKKKRLHRQLRWVRIHMKNRAGRVDAEPFFPLPGHVRRWLKKLAVLRPDLFKREERRDANALCGPSG